MGISEMFRTWLLGPVLTQLTNLQQEIQTMATSVAQFDTLLAQLGTTITAEDATITSTLTAADAVIAKLAAAVAAQGGNVDLTTEATAVQSMIADSQTQAASLTAEVNKINALP